MNTPEKRTIIGVVDDMGPHGDRVALIAASYGHRVRRYDAQGSIPRAIDLVLQAAEEGCKIINVSMVGGSEMTKSMGVSTREKGCLLVCAAQSAQGHSVPQYPAYMAGLPPFTNNVGVRREYDHVISVASCSESGGSRSAADLQHVTIYAQEGAPSWAAPRVSAACASLYDILGDWQLVRQYLVESARQHPTLWDKCEAGGFVDLPAALAQLRAAGGLFKEPPNPIMPPEIDYIAHHTTEHGTLSIDAHEPNLDGKRDEGFANLFDGKPKTKWLAKRQSVHVRIDEPGQEIAGVLLTSGNDAPERDPQEIEVIEAGGPVDVIPVPAFPGRHSVQEVAFPAALPSPVVLRLRSSAPMIQLSGLELLYVEGEVTPAPEPPPLTIEERVEALEKRLARHGIT